MKNTHLHPLLRRRKRPPMTTPPILALANAIARALDENHQGLDVVGSGRIGKSFSQHWLLGRDWYKGGPVATLCVRVPRHTKTTDSYIYSLVLFAGKMKASSLATSLDRLQRLCELLENLCVIAQSSTVVLLVDEAQRLFAAELDDFITIVNEAEGRDIDVFVVFFRQRDVSGVELELAKEHVTSHVKGRFKLAKHFFHGLRGEDEVYYVFDRYDHKTEWPVGSGITYTQYFAPQAFAKGWRLATHTKQVLEAVEVARTTHGLAPGQEWPMKTFEGFVRHVLTVIAARPNFEGLTSEHIEEALEVSGYVALELCRAGRAEALDEDDDHDDNPGED